MFMGRTRWKVASEKKLPIRKRSLEEGMKDWQAVVRKAFATRVCPNCHGALDFFEDGEADGLRCRECGWGFRHTCDLCSDTCHYEFSVPTAVKRSAS
jgi:hypothetical protein